MENALHHEEVTLHVISLKPSSNVRMTALSGLELLDQTGRQLTSKKKLKHAGKKVFDGSFDHDTLLAVVETE